MPLGASSLAIVLLVLAVIAAGIAAAHEGHDDGQPAVASGAQGLPRLVATSEAYELVVILNDERLTIYLDRFEDNSPVTDANITVTVNDEAMAAQPSGDGVYNISSKRFASRGLIELVFDIKAKDTASLAKLFGGPTDAAKQLGAVAFAGTAQSGTDDLTYDVSLSIGGIGPAATELIAEACAAMKLEATSEDLVRTIHAHPTLSEAIHEASEAVLGHAIHI